MSKLVNTNPQDALLKGAITISEAVGSTLGPRGRNVIIDTPFTGATVVTKDGVTVAKVLEVPDREENLAISIIKQAAIKSASNSGDGTTTATVLASSIFSESLKSSRLGLQPTDIKRSIEDYTPTLLENLRALSSDVTEASLYDIATISANNDTTLGTIIGDIYKKIGKDGVVSVQDSKTSETSWNLVEGAYLQRGYYSPYFVNIPDKEEVRLENPLILLTDKKIRLSEELIPALEIAVSKNRPIFIICDEIEAQALQLLIVNNLNNRIRALVIKAPSYGQNRNAILEDLHHLTSAKLITENNGGMLQNVKFEDLGSAEGVISTKDSTTLIGPKSLPSLKERIALLKSSLDGTSEDFFKSQIIDRIASLTSSVANLYVGAATETELQEKKDRVDDAIRATKSSLKSGYVVGGGVALLRLSDAIPPIPELAPLKKALLEPLSVICKNAGVTPQVVISELRKSTDPNFGYNALSSSYENLVKSGVIDPAYVTEQAIVNAISAGMMLLLSAVAITDKNPININDSQ